MRASNKGSSPIDVRRIATLAVAGSFLCSAPLLNPYIDRTGAFQPMNAAPYLDRNRTDPGLLHAGDPAVRAFTDRGWRWCGYWRTPLDYQHFER